MRSPSACTLEVGPCPQQLQCSAKRHGLIGLTPNRVVVSYFDVAHNEYTHATHMRTPFQPLSRMHLHAHARTQATHLWWMGPTGCGSRGWWSAGRCGAREGSSRPDWGRGAGSLAMPSRESVGMLGGSCGWGCRYQLELNPTQWKRGREGEERGAGFENRGGEHQAQVQEEGPSCLFNELLAVLARAAGQSGVTQRGGQEPGGWHGGGPGGASGQAAQQVIMSKLARMAW